MATSVGSVHYSSDLVKDYVCGACESKNLEKSADYFCASCTKFFCGKCIDQHDQLYANHSKYGRGETNKWPLTKTVEDLLLKCDVHKEKKLETFCQDHSQLCCTDCVLLDHRQCTNVALISESVKKMSVDMQQLSNNLQSILDKLSKFKCTQEASIQSVEVSWSEKLQEIRDLRKKLNAALDALENTTLKELDDIRTTLQMSLKKDVDNSRRLKGELQALSEAVQGLCDNSKKEIEFIASRKCLNKIQVSESYLKENPVKVQSSMIFMTNSDMEKFLSQQTSLGRIKTFKINPDQVLAVKRKSEYIVRISSDTSQTCLITGICSLPSGHVIFVDTNNKKVMLLDQHYNVSSHCDLSYNPWDICQITSSEVAVTGNSDVQFISVSNGQLVNGRKLQLPHHTFSIAHHQGALYITSEKALYHYTLSGSLVKKLYEVGRVAQTGKHQLGRMAEEMSTPSSSRKKAKRLPFETQEEIDCLYEFVPEVKEHFEVIDKIGEGTFSSVFLARLKHYPDIPQMFALKHIIPTSHPSRIEGELKCLLEIGGCDNVIGVELCLRNRDHVVIVMQYFPHEKFHEYLLHMSLMDVYNYMKHLLVALRRVHMFDIIHRDVKPSNFLYDRNTKRYALVDFGLAHKAPVCKASQSPIAAGPMDTSGILQETRNLSIGSSISTPVTQTSQSKKPTSSSSKSHQYTPPTPNLSNSVFAKRVKSPRRLLLAKRALLVKEGKDDILSQRKGARPSQPAQCNCFGKPQICSVCSARSNQNAPRAGTPGFRSPEVLMKCPDQSTAVDIWSAGVIFLSLLSGRYPFFRANDDMTAMAQIISTFGTEAVKEAAKACGKNLICSLTQSPVDFRTMCMKLRAAPMSKHQTKKGVMIDPISEQSWRLVPDSAFDLLSRLLDLNPYTRITAAEALTHTFFSEMEERLGSVLC